MNNIRVQFKEFDGPLDVLLNLLDEQKMEISEVSISAVTEPFLAYIDSLDEADPQELADFLIVAAKLLLLKSKTLLPQFTSQEDDGISLEEQLRLYRRFVCVSKYINTWWSDEHKKSYGRYEPPIKSHEVTKPDNFSVDKLHECMCALITRLAPPKPIPQTQIDKTISMKEKIQTIRSLVNKGGHISFHEVLSHSSSKTEIIISFLAILELVKQRHVVISQNHISDDIMISHT